MGASPAQFKIADLARAIKAARRGGMEVGKAEIDPATGKIVLVATSCVAPTESPLSPFEKWKAQSAR